MKLPFAGIFFHWKQFDGAPSFLQRRELSSDSGGTTTYV
jgi:hypothetical protein